MTATATAALAWWTCRFGDWFQPACQIELLQCALLRNQCARAIRFRFGRWSQLFDSDSSSDDGDDENSAGGAKLHAPQRRSDAPEGADGTHLAQPQAQGQEQAHGAQRAGDGEAGRQEPSCDGQTGSLRCPFPLTARVTSTSCSEVALSMRCPKRTGGTAIRHPPSHRGSSPGARSYPNGRVDVCALQGLQPQPRRCTRHTGSVRTAQRAMGVAHSRCKRSGSGATTARSSLPYSGVERPSRHGMISFAAVPPLHARRDAAALSLQSCTERAFYERAHALTHQCGP